MRVLFAKEKTTGFLRGLPRTGFKTDFVAKSSEKSVGKAGGRKGSEACWSTSRTLFADNADPQALQPIAAESSFETSSSIKHDEGQGFTLIELLVVMSVISLLLGISLPVLKKARYQARTLLGTSRQRQIVRAVGLYAADNDDQYPESVATIGFGDHWNWQEPTMLTGYRKRTTRLYRSASAYLSRYINDASVMSCPHAPQAHQYLHQAWEAAEDWGNPESPLIKGSLTGTYCLYWNYTGLLQGQRGLFNGPRNLSGGLRQSTLLVSCYFGYDHWRSRNAYSSCNTFKQADPTEETWFSSSYWSGPDSDDGLDTLTLKLHAGYTDEHVESYGPAEVIPMEVIMNRSTMEPYPSGVGPGIFYLPPYG